MSFSLNQIQSAHAKVKSGADFPRYIQNLIQLGLKSYETFVSDGHSVYFGEADFTLRSDSKYPSLSISDQSDSEKFKHYLKIHQLGETDYRTFCNHAAECGVEKWIIDTTAMTCVYYDKAGNELIKETIPAL
ncbi:MAG: DUF1398 domain-containing protein [Sphingobacteriaceae bacterium]